jgi:GNAT superfamily N-acetyltransferase
MQSVQPSTRRRIGSFNGDFDELAALMLRSWSENKEQPLRYTPEFFRSAFESPGASFELAPAIYRDGRLVAFVAGFPRTVRISDQRQRLLSMSFLTVAPEYKRFGYGPLMWGELLKRARDHGCHGALDFAVEGDPWSAQILSVARVLREPTARIFTVSFLARLLRVNESLAPVAGSESDPAAVLRQAVSHIADEVALRRCWSCEESEWQCSQRAGAINSVTCIEERCGILNGYTVETSGAAPILCAILDNVLWGSLAPAERASLAAGFLAQCARRGVKMIIAPVLGYADMQPLLAAGFRKTRRVLHAYLTLWAAAIPESLGSMYVDVF